MRGSRSRNFLTPRGGSSSSSLRTDENGREAKDCGGSEALFAPEIRLSLVDYNHIKTDDVGFKIYSVSKFSTLLINF